MTSYTSQLKTWGDTGTTFPDGYSYLEGEQPVDAWDNFVNHNTIKDLDHLVQLTNERLDSHHGTTHPASPTAGHFSLRTDGPANGNGDELYTWDSTSAEWHRLMRADGDVMTGGIDMNGNAIANAQQVNVSQVSGLSIIDGDIFEARGYENHALFRGYRKPDTGATTDGQLLTNFVGGGYDGTNLLLSAQVRVEQDGAAQAGSVPGRLSFETTTPGDVGPTPAMEIRADKEVHILQGALRLKPVSEPAAPNFGYKLYADGADDHLKAKHANGTVTTIATN